MQYAAFLRAINVGRTNRITMERLRGLCGDLGLENVSTYLQTGNVLFDSARDLDDAAALIAAGLADEGLKNADVMLRTRDELAAIVASFPPPLGLREERRQLVTFFSSPIPAEFVPLLEAAPGVVGVRPRELLTDEPLIMMQRDPRAPLFRRLGVPGTARYWRVAEAVLGMMRAE